MLKDEEILEYLKKVPTGYVTDALNRLKLAGWMDNIFPITVRKKIVGRAVTVSFGPNRGVNKFNKNFYSLISKCKQGDILVVGSLGVNRWIFGDNTVHAAMNQRLSGVVVDGCIRDSDNLVDEDFAIFCKGASVRPYKSILEIRGFQEIINCAGAQVKPKDIIVGDSDGVVVIPYERVSEVIKQIRDIEILETEQDKLIRNHCKLEELFELLRRKKIVKE